jgi:hypothetical protein
MNKKRSTTKNVNQMHSTIVRKNLNNSRASVSNNNINNNNNVKVPK